MPWATTKFRHPTWTGSSSGVPLHQRLLHGIDVAGRLPAEPHDAAHWAKRLAIAARDWFEAPAEVVLLPRVLHDAGYVTYHCGKSNNACRYGNAAFDFNVETEKSGPDDMRHHGDQVVQFLEKHDRSKPFFIYLAPPVPHDPRVAPEQFRQDVRSGKLNLSRNFMPEHPFDNGELKIRDEQLAACPRTPKRNAPTSGRLLCVYFRSG